MKVSILMPVFNAAPFLAECLNSILIQSFKDWELIAINDHSTDQSLSILQTYAAKDHRIKVYSNEGKGIIPALRLAYAKSQYPLITRMDADDRMPTQKLAQLRAAILGKEDQVLSSGLVEYFSETELGDGYRRYAYWLNQLALEGRQYEHIYRECVIPSPAWMIHRGLLDRCGAFASDTYPEDYDLVFRFLSQKVLSYLDKANPAGHSIHSRILRTANHMRVYTKEPL